MSTLLPRTASSTDSLLSQDEVSAFQDDGFLVVDDVFTAAEIQALRDEYRARTGKTLRDFHDAFVAQGALPIPLVRELLFRDSSKADAGDD